MQDTPDPVDLLEAVSAFLRDEAMPALSGATAFRARVAANALDIVRRQIQLAPAAEQAELESLQALLDDRSGNLAELNRRLCEHIRAGRIDLFTPGLAAHLRRITLDKLAVDQPGYAAYGRAIASTFLDPKP